MFAVLALVAASGWAEVAAGASHESNLTGSAGDTLLVDGSAATVRAHLGGALEPGDDDELFAEAGYSGTLYPAFPDLDQHRPSLTLGWVRWFKPWMRLRVAPFVGLRLARDGARAGWDGGADASLRFRLHSRLRLTIGGGYTHRAASDAAFAWDSARAVTGASIDLWRGGDLRLRYSFDLGDATFYAAPEPAIAPATASTAAGGAQNQGGNGPGGRYGRPVTTFGAALVAYRAGRVAHTASATIGQEIHGGVFVEAAYVFTAVRGDVQAYEAHTGTLEVGFRY